MAPQVPGLFTRSMPATVRPRKTSRLTRRSVGFMGTRASRPGTRECAERANQQQGKGAGWRGGKGEGCRVGKGEGCRVWKEEGCRVWKGEGCRVWKREGCRVWK